MKPLGLEVPNPRHRDLIGDVYNTIGGNIVLRIGTENSRTSRQGWHQTGYIVLTKDEAVDLGLAVLAAARGDKEDELSNG